MMQTTTKKLSYSKKKVFPQSSAELLPHLHRCTSSLLLIKPSPHVSMHNVKYVHTLEHASLNHRLVSMVWGGCCCQTAAWLGLLTAVAWALSSLTKRLKVLLKSPVPGSSAYPENSPGKGLNASLAAMVTLRQTPAAAITSITIFSLRCFSLIAQQQVPLVPSSHFIRQKWTERHTTASVHRLPVCVCICLCVCDCLYLDCFIFTYLPNIQVMAHLLILIWTFYLIVFSFFFWLSIDVNTGSWQGEGSMLLLWPGLPVCAIRRILNWRVYCDYRQQIIAPIHPVWRDTGVGGSMRVNANTRRSVTAEETLLQPNEGSAICMCPCASCTRPALYRRACVGGSVQCQQLEALKLLQGRGEIEGGRGEGGG